MPDPWVHQLGAVTDVHGIPLPVGVDYCCVTIGNCTFSGGLMEEVVRLISHATTQAGWQSASLEAEAGATDDD